MKSSFAAAALAATCLACATPAQAQGGLSPSTQTHQPTQRRLTLGVVAGAAAVQEVGALLGGTLALPVNARLDIVGDGLWSSNAVTRRRKDLASTLASYVQTNQVGQASGDVSAPTFYAGGGVRVPFVTTGTWRPYITVTAGMARVVLRPQIVLNGGDITSKLPQFGITLGSDLTGVQTKPAFSGGFGIRSVRGRCYVDAGVRLINIQTSGQATRVIGASGSFGFSL